MDWICKRCFTLICYRKPIVNGCNNCRKSGVNNLPTNCGESISCKCCVNSSPEWQRNETCDLLKVNEDDYRNTQTGSGSSRKSYRQIFYSNLEDYYRKLYNRARVQSAIEQVGACA